MMKRLLAIVIAAAVVCPRPAAAQYQDGAGIRHSVRSADGARAGAMPPALVPPDRINGTRVAHGVLIGAGVGAVAGLVVAAASPHRSDADNALGYIAAATLGAFVGMLVGAAIGASG